MATRTSILTTHDTSSKIDNGLKAGDFPQMSSKSPAAISFVRNRMFYARAALNTKGRVTFGLRHIRETETCMQMRLKLRDFRCLESVL